MVYSRAEDGGAMAFAACLDWVDGCSNHVHVPAKGLACVAPH